MELVAIPCPICGTSYPSRISVKNHIKVRHPGRNLEVEMQRLIAKYPLLFSTSTSSSSSSPSPTSIRRGRARQYNCDKCSKTFFNFSGFRIHFKSQCVGVSEQSKSVKSVPKSRQIKIIPILKRAKKSMKSSKDKNDLTYEDLTDKDFEDVSILESTISSKNNSIQSKDFEDVSILDSSQSSNEPSKMELDMNLNESKCDKYITTDNANLKCQRCDNGRVYGELRNLERHVEGVHKLSLGNKYKCEKCGQGYKYAQNLANHDCDFSSESKPRKNNYKPRKNVNKPRKNENKPRENNYKPRKNNCLRCHRFRPKNQMYCAKCLDILEIKNN